MRILTYEKTENTNGVKETGAALLVDALIENGVDTIFGYPGTPILSVYDELSKTDIKHILNRHEQASIHAAEGYAKVSGKCGVVLTTSGPGFTNTITGLMNACSDYSSVLVITVQTETTGKNEFQEADIQSITKTFVKKSHIITDAENITKVISQAITETTRLPKGPVVVGITKSALEQKCERNNYRKKQEIKVEAPHSCVLKAIDMLKNSKSPLIIVGGGCKDSHQELKELVSLTQIPVVHTLMGKGCADTVSLGMIGSNGLNSLNTIISNSDVVLALGVRFTDRTTNYVSNFLPDSKVISINLKKNTSKNVVITKEIIGELKVVLQQMIGVIKSKNILFDINYDWIDKLNNTLHEEFNVDSTDIVLNEIYNYVKKYSPIITTDVGEHQISASKIFNTNHPQNFITSGGFGTMGYGLPAAIGANVAKPNGLVINITGDGSFQMNIQELATCAEYNIPIKIFIINNSSLGMIKNQQIKNNFNLYQSNLINPDFAQIAKGYGILGYTINSIDELKNALLEIFKYKKTVVLDIKI